MALDKKHIIHAQKQFADQYAKSEDSLLPELAKNGQQPKALIIGCVDARVDPSLALNLAPGELLISRNVGAIVPPYLPNGPKDSTAAALEFGICQLNIPHLIIMGHSECGGMQVLSGQKITPDEFISHWVETVTCDESSHDLTLTTKQAIAQSAENALSYPWIESRVEAGELTLHQWFFEIRTGIISCYDETAGDYIRLIDSPSLNDF
jgi:carbonic anhydrase